MRSLPDFTETRSSGGLHNLSAAKYLFRCRAQTRTELPAYKGSALHGGFGHALKKIALFYYDRLFAPGKAGDLPRPLVLLPPLDDQTRYDPGHTFTFELTLFGSAAHHFSICHSALEYLGREMGFGNNRGKFVIEDIAAAIPPSCSRQKLAGQMISGEDIAEGRSGLAYDHVTLLFPTRLRLKDNGNLVRHAPPFRLFFARLLGRLNTLSSVYCNGTLTDHNQRDELLEKAKHIEISKQKTFWSDLPRFSGRQQKWMKFGGLQGSVTYAGDLKPFLPYLALGEWTHTGGKTSFGLGKYVMEERDD